MKFQTIATYYNPEEAYLAKIKLSLSGIESFVIDENFVRLDYFYALISGGIRLMVFTEDFEDAGKIIYSKEEPLEDQESSFEKTCPKCSSHRLGVDDLPRRLMLVGLLTSGFPFLPLGRQLICRDCGQRQSQKTGRKGFAWEFVGWGIFLHGGFLFIAGVLSPVLSPLLKIAQFAVGDRSVLGEYLAKQSLSSEIPIYFALIGLIVGGLGWLIVKQSTTP